MPTGMQLWGSVSSATLLRFQGCSFAVLSNSYRPYLLALITILLRAAMVLELQVCPKFVDTIGTRHPKLFKIILS